MVQQGVRAYVLCVISAHKCTVVKQETGSANLRVEIRWSGARNVQLGIQLDVLQSVGVGDSVEIYSALSIRTW